MQPCRSRLYLAVHSWLHLSARPWGWLHNHSAGRVSELLSSPHPICSWSFGYILFPSWVWTGSLPVHLFFVRARDWALGYCMVKWEIIIFFLILRLQHCEGTVITFVKICCEKQQSFHNFVRVITVTLSVLEKTDLIKQNVNLWTELSQWVTFLLYASW